MKVFQFLRYRFLFITISIVAIVSGFILTAVQGGFNLGLDFQAGVSIQVKIDPSVAAPIEEVRAALQGLDKPQIQIVGNPANQEYVIKVKQVVESETFSTEIEGKVRTSLGERFGAQNIQVQKTEYVGPRFSANLASQAAFLTAFALLLILLYCWFRFKLAYAVAAIVATLHDTLFMIGFIGATQIEVSTATVAAVLTIIGYSLNDTIVIFDRIRENAGLMRDTPFSVVINTSISQSLGRTVITSLTTLIAIFAVFLFGTGDVKYFALNVIVGVVVGTYSSIFIASPVLLSWRNAAERFRKKREAKKNPGRMLEKGRDKEEVVKGVSKGEVVTSAPLESDRKVETPVVSREGELQAQGITVAADFHTRDTSSSRTVKEAPPRLSREKRKRKGKK
jgi:preprotein translocase subunit SecF